MKIRLLLALAGLVTGFGWPILAQQKVSSPSEGTPEATPTPTLEDYDTQILPDRHVIFRLLAPNARDVKVLIGVTSSVNESQGTTTAQMKKNANGLWTVTLSFLRGLSGPMMPTAQRSRSIRGIGFSR